MILAGTAAGQVMMFDARRKVAEAQLRGAVEAFLLEPDGIVAVTQTGHIARLSRDTLALLTLDHFEDEPWVALCSASYSGDAVLVVASAHGHLAVLHPPTFEQRVLVNEAPASIISVAGLGDEVLYATESGELRRLSTNPVGPPRTAYFASSEPFTRLVVTAGRACALTTASELLVYSLAADDEPAVEAARGDVCLGSLDDDAVLVAANGELRRLRVASLTSDLLGRATEPDARFIAGRNELLAIANDVELGVYRLVEGRVQRASSHRLSATALAVL